MMRLIRLLAAFAVLALVLAACNEADAPETAAEGPAGDAEGAAEAEGAEGEEPLSIAFFASSSQNAYNQAVYEGLQQAAEEAGVPVETEIFDGEFDAEVQYNQIQDNIAAGRFDGFVVVPNDTVGIQPVIEQAFDAGIPVATALFPIGPDLSTLEPQVEGIITAAVPPGPQAEELAEGVVEYCEGIDPCRVAVLIGQLQFPFDNVRYEAFLDTLEPHDNIEVIATGEGNYDRDQSLQAMQDIIQANQGGFDVLLSNADQHVAGAMIALDEAGFPIEEMYIAGGGATETAIEGIREGTWDATAVNFPFSEGLLAGENLINNLRGEEFEQVIDMTEAGPIPESVITAETLEEYPDFEPEWDA